MSCTRRRLRSSRRAASARSRRASASRARVATDWHNLRARILQLRANDSAAAAIAANARAFVGGFSAEVSVCAALKAVAEYAALATPARWEETVRGLLAAPHLPLVEVYSAARKT